MAARKLTLRKDTLTELSTVNLSQIVGGQETVVFCGMTGYYPSIFDPCSITESLAC